MLIVLEYTAVDSEKKTRVKIQIKNAEKQVAEWKKSIEDIRKELRLKFKRSCPFWSRRKLVIGISIFGGEYVIWDRLFRGVFWSSQRLETCLPYPQIPESSSGRLELARWISSPQNPLTARVFVNRVWHHLFGRGIVASPDNFGEMGNRPTHPELLDYLAQFFIDKKWSTKALIRKIVLSSTYQNVLLRF